MNENHWTGWKVLSVKSLGDVFYGEDAPLPNEPDTRVQKITVNDNIVTIFGTREGAVRRPYRRLYPPAVKSILRVNKLAAYNELLKLVDQDAVHLQRAFDVTSEEWEVNKPWPKAFLFDATVMHIIENSDGTLWCFCLVPPENTTFRHLGFVVELLPLTVAGAEAELEPSAWEEALAGATEGTQNGQVNDPYGDEPDGDEIDEPDGEDEEEEEEEEEAEEPEAAPELEAAPEEPALPLVTTPTGSLDALKDFGSPEATPESPDASAPTTSH